MAVILEAFPKMSRNLLVKTGYNSAIYSFKYKYQGEERDLTTTTADTSTSRAAVLQLSDQACHWHPETSNFIISSKCTINVPFFLFGEKGLAAADGGVIGVALMWMMPDASQRGVVPIGELTQKTKGPCEISGEIVFAPKELRGTLIIQTVLFLKEAGNPIGTERYQAQQPGTILGVLDETRVIIDGNGSLFPIHEVSAPNEPLWWVRCEWDDPLEDAFVDDNFCIYLNTAHKDYSALNVNEGLKNSSLLMEILCASLQILIMKVLNDDTARDATIQGSGIVEGSVSSMVNYFLHTFKVNYDQNNPEALAIDIRKAMMKMV